MDMDIDSEVSVSMNWGVWKADRGSVFRFTWFVSSRKDPCEALVELFKSFLGRDEGCS